jgi:hypothetical protein
MRSILYYIISKIKKLQGKITSAESNIEDLEGEELLSESTSTSGTLTKNINLFKKLKIFYSTSDGLKSSCEIFSNNENIVNFDMKSFNNKGILYIKSALGTISGTDLSITRQYESVLRTTPSITISSGSYITISNIIGYK